MNDEGFAERQAKFIELQNFANREEIKPKKQIPSCFLFGCGGCLGAFVLFFMLIIFPCIFIMGSSDTSSDHNVSVQTVPGFEQGEEGSIVVIPVHGVIMYGKGKNGIVTPEAFSAMLKKAEEDPDVKAVIISIDSPGGEVNAADEIYRRILAYREKTNNPVVALMRSMATSGGYYIAAACDQIIASDTTMTGSIGVIISSYNVKGLLDKIGVHGEVYKSGEMKDMLNPARERTPEERKIVQEMVQECYIKFASIVSKSRKIPLEKITNGPIGDGRIYHGKKALDYGMIDKIGYLEDAVIVCTQIKGFKKDSLKVIKYQKTPGFFDTILEESSGISNGVNVRLNLPGNTPRVDLEPGRLYYLPAGL